MAFGQAAGPPASAQQLASLADLLRAAGYDGFREARHPLGLTQRQANGKFTRAEADELTERLEAAAEPADTAEADDIARAGADDVVRRPRTPGPARSRSHAPRAEPDLTAVTDDALVAELGRRGWICSPPI